MPAKESGAREGGVSDNRYTERSDVQPEKAEGPRLNVSIGMFISCRLVQSLKAASPM